MPQRHYARFLQVYVPFFTKSLKELQDNNIVLPTDVPVNSNIDKDRQRQSGSSLASNFATPLEAADDLYPAAILNSLTELRKACRQNSPKGDDAKFRYSGVAQCTSNLLIASVALILCFGNFCRSGINAITHRYNWILSASSQFDLENGMPVSLSQMVHKYSSSGVLRASF